MNPVPPPPPRSEALADPADRPPTQGLIARIDAINQVLPQTQCQRCGYPACRPYAEAIALGEAAINRCPPGGQDGIAQLAALTGQPRTPLDPHCGQEGPLQKALIREADCIGCVLCLEACPVDAIAGAFKRMHTVIDEDCTGCALCVPVCPVDCIEMITPDPAVNWDSTAADAARARYERRQRRLARPKRTESTARKKAILAAALARAARRRQAP